MSKLTDLLRQVERKDPQLAADLDREYRALSARRAFGLNFERHYPESTEIAGRTVRKDDKVRLLPTRGSLESRDKTLWVVKSIERADGQRVALLAEHGTENPQTRVAHVDDLVVVSVFRDYIYPGLVQTGKVERSSDKPSHTVINGENFHALKTLTFTHEGKIDVIYIDPPYNTGSKDWKYNNDYVEGEDIYRHSKWLAFIERRLLMAKDLLNPDDSVLIVTIDEKEYLRLGLLLEQTFPEAKIQMVSTVINQNGSARAGELTRVNEFVYFCFFGSAVPAQVQQAFRGEDRGEGTQAALAPVRWERLMRGANGALRSDRPNLFYPVFVNPKTAHIAVVGEPLALDEDRSLISPPAGLEAVWPISSDNREKRWQVSHTKLRELVALGLAKVGSYDRKNDRWSLSYLNRGQIERWQRGEFVELGRDDNGVVQLEQLTAHLRAAPTSWDRQSHSAGEYGSRLLTRFVPGRKFPFPKSLYAVEDTLRIAVALNPNAVVLDFFAGSGTTAHAVMRLNRQDGGRRQCISVTNNEVAADEQKALHLAGLRPGDPGWERWGICDHITKPRLEAVIKGQTPEGAPVKGEYKFVDEFPMAEGMEENASFFTLTYETRTEVTYNKAFERIAPLLWLRAGAKGSCIDTEPPAGWEMADAYGVLVNLDNSSAFVEAIKASDGVAMAFIVTDDERRFQAVARRLPHGIEAVRLYESYLRNFQIRNGG